MKKTMFLGMMLVVIVSLCVLWIRPCLMELGMPDGGILEEIAEQLRSKEVTAGEAVAVFCREILNAGTP